ncbi:MAG: hypothetical protein IPP23_10045 [Sphingomonadales bacterium]|nr:hypothetical protein [Sphingomonadales bacterium]
MTILRVILGRIRKERRVVFEPPPVIGLGRDQNKSRDTLSMYAETYKEVADGKIGLPTPAKAALSILRYIGDKVQEAGEKLDGLPAEFQPKSAPRPAKRQSELSVSSRAEA